MKYLVKFTDSDIQNIILNICILLFGINFLYKCNYVVIGTFVLLFLFKKYKINYGNIPTLLMLILFAISWFIFSDGHEMAGVCLPICYLIGVNISSDNDKDIIKFILLVAISLAFYTTLFFINNAITNGITNYDVYNQTNIWTGRSLWATNIMLYSSLFYSCFGYIVFGKSSKLIKVIYTVVFVINAFYALMLSRRAALLMIIISIFISFLYKILIDSDDRKKVIRIFTMICFVGMIAVFILALFYIYNLFGFQNIVKDTDLYVRFIGRDDPLMIFNDMGRSAIRKEFMKYVCDYPWGGSRIHELIGNYAHDIWLDTYDVAGIVSLIVMIIYTVMFAISLIGIVKNKTISSDIRLLASCLLICVFAQMCIEPIMEACRAYMFAVCMIHGSFDTIKKN